jgi:hypothetical protein
MVTVFTLKTLYTTAFGGPFPALWAGNRIDWFLMGVIMWSGAVMYIIIISISKTSKILSVLMFTLGSVQLE